MTLIVVLFVCFLFFPTLSLIAALVFVTWYFGWKTLWLFLAGVVGAVIAIEENKVKDKQKQKLNYKNKTQKERPRLTTEQQLCYKWATEHKFWRNSIRDEASFLKILNNPKVTLDKQYKNYLRKKGHEVP